MMTHDVHVIITCLFRNNIVSNDDSSYSRDESCDDFAIF